MSKDTKTYWGGPKLDAPIRVLEARNFHEFVNTQINVPVVFRMTRQDFLAHPDRDRLKDGPYIMACTFPDGKVKRNNANADGFNLVIIDLDEGAFIHDFIEHPETLGEALSPYNFAAFLTAKSTPEAPRMKVVVSCPQLPVERHKPAVSHVINLLGLPQDFKGRRESAVLSQPQYRPMQFADEDYAAVVCSRTDGEDLTDFPDLAEDDPDIGPYAYSGEPETDLAFMPIHNLGVEDVRDALEAIDPDCNYRVWTEVACALRHQFSNEGEAREAFDLFDAWSARGIKYRGVKETACKWRSFRPYAKGRNPVTVRSLFKHSMDAGWKPVRVAAIIQKNVLEWIAECGDCAELLEEGAARIAAMPFRNDVVEEVMVRALQQRIKTLSGNTVAVATIKKQVANTKFRDKQEADSDVPGWLRPFCFIAPENLFYNITNAVSYLPEAFNNAFSKYLMPGKDDPELAKSGRPTVLPVHKALNLVKIDVVDGKTYDPRQGGNQFFDEGGKRYVNQYLPSSVPIEDPVNSAGVGRLFRKLLHEVVWDPEYERVLMNFWAFIVQNPGMKIRWMAFLQSAQGAGKSTLTDCVGAAIGDDPVSGNYKIINPAAMASDFNSWRYGSQYCVVDELKSPGHAKQDLANKLKDAVTNQIVCLNQKFKDLRMINNVTNYTALSNWPDALFVEDSDRRMFVIESRLQTREQVVALRDTGIFDKIHHAISKHKGAFRHFFMNHEIDDDFPVNGPAPDTRFRKALIDEGKNQMQIDIETLIDGPNTLIGRDLILISELHRCLNWSSGSHQKTTHYLLLLGYRVYRDSSVKFSVGGFRSTVWAHLENYNDGLDEPVEKLLRERAVWDAELT